MGTCGIDVCMLFLGSVGCKHPLKFCILCLATVSDKHIQTLVLVGCVLVSLNFNRIVTCTAPPVMWDGLHVQCSATFCYTVGWLPVSPGGVGMAHAAHGWVKGTEQDPRVLMVVSCECVNWSTAWLE